MKHKRPSIINGVAVSEVGEPMQWGGHIWRTLAPDDDSGALWGWCSHCGRLMQIVEEDNAG